MILDDERDMFRIHPGEDEPPEQPWGVGEWGAVIVAAILFLVLCLALGRAIAPTQLP